jgi:hypothetical protein
LLCYHCAAPCAFTNIAHFVLLHLPNLLYTPELCKREKTTTMPEPAGSSAECDDAVTAADIPSNEDPDSESATPLQGCRRGFPVMPPRNNMIPMFVTPKPSSRENLRARNGPPIDEWEAMLVGKKLVPEDAKDNENVCSVISMS